MDLKRKKERKKNRGEYYLITVLHKPEKLVLVWIVQIVNTALHENIFVILQKEKKNVYM